MKKPQWRLLSLLVLLFSLPAPRAHAQADPAPFVWIEGEDTASVNVTPNVAGWGRKEFLSGEKWLHISIDADKVDGQLPAGGALLQYRFDAPKAARYALWNRIGYEFVRSPFEWRIDDGPWTRVGPDALTTDLMELAEWTEVAWLKLGEQTLAAGPHTLEIRLPRTVQTEGSDISRASATVGKPARVLYASDALCLHAGTLAPNGKHRPGDSGRDARDEAAAKHAFSLPEPGSLGERAAVALDGLWEVCRNDEQMPPADVAQPMTDFPAQPHWKAIPVPGDKNTLRPDLVFAHRLWYRTRVNVPASLAGRSFQLVFPQNNLNTTVFVNGVYCGFNKNPYARFSIDITKGIRPNRANEIWVGIRDAWYGYSTNPGDPMKLRRKFNLPLSVTGRGFQELAYPIWNAFRSGILFTPTLVAAGSVYAADVFVKPSVAKKELAAEITLRNPTAQSVAGEIVCEAVDDKTHTVEKRLAARPFTLGPGAEQTVNVAGPWENPRLWWPDAPHLYRLRTTINVDGWRIDLSDTPFGFREWGSRGKLFTLNGIVWRMWADLGAGQTPEEWLAHYRKTNQRTMRLMGAAQGGITWLGLSTDQALDFFDLNGVVVRRSGPLDGEAIGYMAVETDPDLKKLYNSDIKMDLMNNWRDQMVAQVRGERNHPSIQIWSIENEWLYINCINLYAHLMDAFEREVTRCSEAVRAADPTRLTMVDGGGATKAQTLPVHGDHYVFNPADTGYPDLAYRPNPTAGGRGRWVWDQLRPRFVGEDYFATGINPADYALFGGEAAFQGKAQARPAATRIYRLLTEGYRWADYAAWQFWLGDDNVVNPYNSNAPLAVFVREWDWTFGAGQKIRRTVGIFNDTRHSDPVTFTWALTVAGRKIAGQAAKYAVPAGTSRKIPIILPMPNVPARREGQLVLALSVKGKPVFRDVKAVSVMGATYPPRPPSPAYLTPRPPSLLRSLALTGKGEPRTRGSRAWWEASPNPGMGAKHRERGALGSPFPVSASERSREGGRGVRYAGAKGLVVYDPQGATAAFLQSRGVPFTRLRSLGALPADGRVLLVGEDALDAREATSSRLAAWASGGRRVIVLEQKHPLQYQGLPAEMEATASEGRIAYGEDMGHPVLRGLQQKDFFTWGADGIVYRNAYRKPTRGGKSLVQCDVRLQNTALAEVPVGGGLLLLSQLVVGEKLAGNAVAQHLLMNLLAYATQYRQEFRPAVLVADDPLLAKTLDALGLQYKKMDDPVRALAVPGIKLAVVSATPANLHRLAGNPSGLKAFMNRGGYLVLHGLTPEGLPDYNRIVGFDHMIRPFRRERVLFPATRHPLTAGITAGDIVMLSGERIFPWTSDEYVASDIFSAVVDYDEVAPFAQMPSDYHYNIVNGFVTADAWKLIFSFDLNQDPVPQLTMRFPKPQTLRQMEWIGNALYHRVTGVELKNERGTKARFATRPDNEPQTFAITPPLAAKDLTLRITDWEKVPAAGGNVVGIDNLRLWAKRPPEFYRRVRPLLSVGGLMEYPRGPGGILLCNLLFKDAEAVPVNQTKKRTILAAVLRNLHAPFSGKTVIAGAGLKYETLDLSRQANQYRDERGWFGDKQFTFADLPTGRQVFAGLPFQIYSFPTSPVPTAIMLGGPGVPNNLGEAVRGIPVNRHADALFFLHTARIDRRRSEGEVREGKRRELARYVVTYADGQTAEVPVYAEIDVEEYRQKTPAPIPGAQIAWTRPYAGTEFSAVAYVKQWNNPRPEAMIRSIALEYPPGAPGERPGVPVLLAVTAATAR